MFGFQMITELIQIHGDYTGKTNEVNDDYIIEIGIKKHNTYKGNGN